MATNIDFIVKNGLQVATTATVNGVNVLANDYATLLSAYANDAALYSTVLDGYRSNDYTTYTTLQGEFQANDYATLLTSQANDYTTYTTLTSEYQSNDYATLNEARANDYSTYTTLVSEYQANDYSTYATLQSEYQANDYATWSGLNSFAGIKANSSITLTAGDGLSGGGDLTQNRSFAVDATVVRTSGDQSISGQKTFTDSVIVEGDLTINGNVTTVSSTNLEVTDRFIQLASNASGAPSADVGIYLNRGDQGNSAIYYNETNNYFALVDTLDPASNSVVSPTNYSNLRVEHLVVNNSDLVNNLNADLLDSQQGSYYLDFANATNTDLITLDSVTSNGATTANSIEVGGINAGSGLLYTDTANARVGVNTESPLAQLQVSNTTLDTSTITTTTTTANQVLDSFSAASFRTAKYLVQVHDTSNNYYHTSEILVIHDGTTAYITEYAIVFTVSSLASFDADVSGGTVRLLVTPTNTNNTIRVSRTAILA